MADAYLARARGYGFYIVLGFGLLMWVARDAHVMITCGDWRSAPGVITHLGTEIDFNWVSNRSEYRPVVAYHFQVDGRTYSGTVFQVPALGGTKEWAEQQIRKWPNQSQFSVRPVESPVWYDPKDPRKNSLQRPIWDPEFVYGYGAIGLAMFLFGVVGLARMFFEKDPD